jgi:hypothetical protein
MERNMHTKNICRAEAGRTILAIRNYIRSKETIKNHKKTGFG